MVAKFITSTIRIPTISWFRKEETQHEPEQNPFARTAEIKARIAALRSSLNSTQKSAQTAQVQSEPVVAEKTQQPPRATDREQKTRELDAMKLKLMGKKK